MADSWYQLASLHDKAGRYDEAFDDLTRAKKIFSGAATPHLDDAWKIARVVGQNDCHDHAGALRTLGRSRHKI